jgi:cell wall-associated NlpC family hydrolase
MRLQRKKRWILLTACVALAASALPTGVAQAAQTIEQVQAQVTSLQIQASAIAESAQQAQVELQNLQRSLSSVQSKDSAQSANITALKKAVGMIAAEQYKNGVLSQGMQLLFSSDPTLYMNSAQSLSIVESRNATQLRQFASADQQLKATAVTLGQQVALVAAAKAKYVAEEAAAQAKLKQAQVLLNSLNKAERARLAALQASEDSQYQASSLALAKQGSSVTGAEGVALRYALKQLGSRYMFGAAGLVYWDCSGLTMRAFEAAGIELPHSAAAQASYGKPVPLSQVKPGDLVFFGQPIAHVGIYFGNGKMLDAPHSGARVRIENFGSYFGGERYVAARRI